jgi:dihydrofolate synthase / folylpolyglutamate synthase
VDGVLSPPRRSAYLDALDFLFARTTGKTKFGLERTEALLAELGDPHRRLTVFHVAGTNGKGSVCATLDTILRARGFRVGRYTSPHLVDFRERMLIDGARVDEDAVTDFIAQWTPAVERLGATFFEATTALAFDVFDRAGVDVAIIETGLGGRLDSTNVVQPRVAGLASIGIDHTEYLGDTVEQIAAEKAGIFKANAPAVIGTEDPAIRHLLGRLAAERGANPIRIVADESVLRDVEVGTDGTSFTFGRPAAGVEPRRLRTALVGAHQAGNAALALTMLDAAGAPFRVSLDEAAALLPSVRLPGRFQRWGKFIFDVAHNPDGARVLAKTVREVVPPEPVVALLTVLGDKDWRGIIDALAGTVSHFVITRAPTAPASRAWDPAEAAAYAAGKGLSAERNDDFDAALEAASTAGATVLVTGSFHTVGDAMARLQVDPVAG